MEEIVIQINGGIPIDLDVIVKKVMYKRNIMFGTLLRVIMKMENT